MASFGFLTEKSELVESFIEKTNQRLEVHHILKNPFEGRIIKIKGIYLASMNPMYPNLSLLGLIFILGWFAIFGFKLIGWYIPGLVLLVSGVFWSKYFFYLMLKKGLKKEGYTGIVKLIPNNKIIERIVKGGADRSFRVP